MDHEAKGRRADRTTAVNHRADPPPFDGAHPVRLVLVLDVIALLQRHGYRRTGRRRSLADFLRILNALVESYESSGC